MANYVLYQGLDDEKRKLRNVNAVLKRHLETLRERREEAEDRAKEWQRKYEEQQKEIAKLKEENEKLRRQRDTYRDMLFKANRSKEASEKQQATFQTEPQRKRGGQVGHTGHGRRLPLRIDTQVHIFANTCPICNGKLNRSKTTVSHTVEDIPALQQQQTIVTKYAIEKQWCGNCKKEITVTPDGVIPASRLELISKP